MHVRNSAAFNDFVSCLSRSGFYQWHLMSNSLKLTSKAWRKKRKSIEGKLELASDLFHHRSYVPSKTRHRPERVDSVWIIKPRPVLSEWWTLPTQPGHTQFVVTPYFHSLQLLTTIRKLAELREQNWPP